MSLVSILFGHLFLLFCCMKLTFSGKAYPLGCSGRDPSFYDYENYVFPPATTSTTTTDDNNSPSVPIRTCHDFLILKRLGTGKFSDVFEAVDRSFCPNNNGNGRIDPSSIVVLKRLKPVSDRKIRREVLILQHASNLPNMARILGVVLPPPPSNNPGNFVVKQVPKMPTLVLAHAGRQSQWLCHRAGSTRSKTSTLNGRVATSTTTLVQNRTPQEQDQININSEDDDDDDLLSEFEIRYYLFHLLVALDSLHACGMMHRDVKPRNVLIQRQEKTLQLIDLGLADFYLPHQKYNVRVASRHYKSPELLLNFEYYDYALDLWGVGCILAGLLFQREPFFRGRDNLDQLGKIIARLGTLDLIDYVVKFQMQLPVHVQTLLSEYHARGALHRLPWNDLDSSANEFQLQGMDLLDKLLVYDHEQRWNAREAMEHPFFDPVREEILNHIATEKAKS